MGETWYIGRQRLELMRLESEAILAANPHLRGPYRPAPKPVVIEPEPTEYQPPAKAKPLAIAMGLLNHELATKAAPVAMLIAKAAKLGASESTLRRAKKACNVTTIKREDGYWWELGVRLEG